MIQILRKEGWVLNPNDKVVNAILRRCEANNGECPCHNTGEDKKCPCSDYREKECKREIDKELYTSNHSDRKRKIRSRQNEVQTNLKELLTDIKKNSKCAICNESRWWVLDFHHIRDKRFEVSSLARRGCSLETFKEEIDKCIVICANCHRDLHFKESEEYNNWSNEKRT